MNFSLMSQLIMFFVSLMSWILAHYVFCFLNELDFSAWDGVHFFALAGGLRPPARAVELIAGGLRPPALFPTAISTSQIYT